MARNFYKKGDDWFYSDNNQKILNFPELQAAQRAGGQEVDSPEFSFGWGNVPGGVDPREQPYLDAEAANPALQEAAQGGSSIEDIVWAVENNDFSGILDFNGQPFSPEAQQEAMTQGMEDNRLYYEALQAKETADAESSLAQDAADYQDYLINAGQSFEADKSRSDQQSANQGVLFSGSRVQKEKNMQRAYEQDQATTQRNMASNISNTARDFQYKYGTEAAGGLSQYYNLGGNTFNPNVARGGVGSSGISNVYNPGNNYNYQGTRNTERSSNTKTRAADYLKNKGNKLLSSGYNNQL